MTAGEPHEDAMRAGARLADIARALSEPPPEGKERVLRLINEAAVSPGEIAYLCACLVGVWEDTVVEWAGGDVERARRAFAAAAPRLVADAAVVGADVIVQSILDRDGEVLGG